MPAAIREVEDWLQGLLQNARVPDEAEVLARFARPLAGQILTDCGPTVSRLVDERLGMDIPPRSVRDQARQLGVTRARVYQLLDDVGKVMSVRWPEGQSLIDRLTSHFTPLEQRQGQLRLFFGLSELCFPEKAAGAGESSAETSAELQSAQPAAAAYASTMELGSVGDVELSLPSPRSAARRGSDIAGLRR
jgi:hypothetical protein